MITRFRRIGEDVFPGDPGNLTCGVYEWTPLDAKRHCKFKIQFLSPDEEGWPRVYYVAPLLRHIFNDKLNPLNEPTSFLERACRFGNKILAELDRAAPQTSPASLPYFLPAYPVFQALFRNRHKGHVGVGRHFRTSADFVDNIPGREPQLITPGIDADDVRIASRSEGTVRSNSRALLRKALSPPGGPRPELRVPFQDVRDAYVARFERGRQLNIASKLGSFRGVPLGTFPGGTALDYLFADGLSSRQASWTWADAVTKIGGAIIYGRFQKTDRRLALDNQSWFVRAFVRLKEAVESKSP